MPSTSTVGHAARSGVPVKDGATDVNSTDGFVLIHGVIDINRTPFKCAASRTSVDDRVAIWWDCVSEGDSTSAAGWLAATCDLR